MTMRSPRTGNDEIPVVRPTFKPDGQYRFTWPGQPPKMVSGAELAAICKGANHEMLQIEEVTDLMTAIASLDTGAPDQSDR